MPDLAAEVTWPLTRCGDTQRKARRRLAICRPKPARSRRVWCAVSLKIHLAHRVWGGVVRCGLGAVSAGQEGALQLGIPGELTASHKGTGIAPLDRLNAATPRNRRCRPELRAAVAGCSWPRCFLLNEVTEAAGRLAGCSSC